MSRSNKPHDVFKQYDMRGGDREQCWTWTGIVNAKDGRPYFTVNGDRRPAYVWALIAFTGEMPDGRSALHSCDNKLCGNVYHLSWGTQLDNIEDMMKRDRSGLPRSVVKAIRKLLDEGRTQQDIADLYGIKRETVSQIKTGKYHKDD